MGELFNWNNKFFQWLNKMIDCVCLSLIWLLCCIPIFTAGAATTALYYTVHKVIRYNRGYLMKDFFRSFVTNFKQSTIVWIVFLLLAVFMGTDAYIMWSYLQMGNAYGNLVYLFLVFLALVIMWGIYLFPYIARFENKTKAILKNAALIAVLNLGKTLLLFVIWAAGVALFVWMPFLILFLPAFVMLTQNMILEKIFRKYMSEEDLAEEEERNREFFN